MTDLLARETFPARPPATELYYMGHHHPAVDPKFPPYDRILLFKLFLVREGNATSRHLDTAQAFFFTFRPKLFSSTK